ncbi:MAG: hypothetical protein AAF756_16985 [Pseudomonadota bacterium]
MWLETITVRSSRLDAVVAYVRELTEEFEPPSPHTAVAVYLREAPTCDLSIHLLSPDQSNHSTGWTTRIAAALGEFGTVDHALWRPLDAAEDEPNASSTTTQNPRSTL